MAGEPTARTAARGGGRSRLRVGDRCGEDPAESGEQLGRGGGHGGGPGVEGVLAVELDPAGAGVDEHGLIELGLVELAEQGQAGVGAELAELHGTAHRVLPDMIEIGSFIGLAAMTQSDLLIKDVSLHNLGVIPEKFAQLGIKLNIEGDNIHIPEQDLYEIQTYLDGGTLTVYDHPWPGLTPDLLSIILVVATQAKGSVLIHQKMFESRLFFVDKLIDMGARIVLCDPHRAVVVGLERKYPLRGIKMSSPDIRAGVAMLIAALSADGESIIQNADQIDRGYQYIDKRLQALGACIERI